MKKDKWLIVANSTIAHVFKIQRQDSLIEIETLVHPESRLHNRDLVSDKPGRDFESFGARRHSMEQKTDPKDQEFMIFADHIVKYLDNAKNEGKFDRLYLAASPNFLGLLRQRMVPAIGNLIGGEVNKDLTQLTPEEIINNLPFPM